MHCCGKCFLTPDFHLLVKNRAANLGPASLVSLWNLSFDTQQNHYEMRGPLQSVRPRHGALTQSILDLDPREILLISCPGWCGLLMIITRWVQCRLSLDLGEATGWRKEKGLKLWRLPQTALMRDSCMMKCSLLKYYISTHFMLIASPCCRNNTKSTVFTAKTCDSGRIPCNIKQLLLIFAQALWGAEPNTFISTAEPDPFYPELSFALQNV